MDHRTTPLILSRHSAKARDFKLSRKTIGLIPCELFSKDRVPREWEPNFLYGASFPPTLALLSFFFRRSACEFPAPHLSFGLHVWVNFSIARQRARQNEEEALRVWKLNAAERKARAEKKLRSASISPRNIEIL